MHAARRNLDVAYFMMDNEIYGLTKGQTAPTTPAGDKTKSSHYGNPEPSIDPCELAISVGATWVARAFSGDLKGTVELMVKALSHRGFAFLNVISPCVTWRGDDLFKTLKAKQKHLPEDHDPTSRTAALAYTRETEVVTTGVLYDIAQPSYIDRLDAIKKTALAGKPAPTVADIIKTFEPSF
jgi:2-oxoglutarate ferredoxin oxidoreductase subunit beta